MLKLWKAGTLVFVLQVVTTIVAYMISGSMILVLICALLVAALVLMATAVYDVFAVVPTTTVSFASLTILGAVVVASFFAFVGATLTALVILFTFTVLLAIFLAAFVALVVFYVSLAFDVVGLETKEPKPALLVAVLPLGIGTVLGGLLYFFKYRNKQVETA